MSTVAYKILRVKHFVKHFCPVCQVGSYLEEYLARRTMKALYGHCETTQNLNQTHCLQTTSYFFQIYQYIHQTLGKLCHSLANFQFLHNFIILALCSFSHVKLYHHSTSFTFYFTWCHAWDILRQFGHNCGYKTRKKR